MRVKQPRAKHPLAGVGSPRATAFPFSGLATDLLAAAALALIVFLPHLSLAGTEHLTPDAAGYLDMGRNFFSGRGAVSTYNLYQYWSGFQHPALPYMQPLYPVLCGLLWKLDGLRAVTAFNILLFAVNCGLVYLLTLRMVGRWTAFLTGMLLGFSPNLLLSAIHPWTEQLHLLTLLSAVLLFLNERVPRFWIGVMLGIGCLVRVAGIYNAAALLGAVFVMHGLRKPAFAQSAAILAGFLAIMVPYELFCLFRYGTLYPEYLAAAKRYAIAVASGGASYRNGLPVLQVAAEPAMSAGLFASRFLGHVTGLLSAFAAAAPLAVIAPLALVSSGALRRKPAFAVFTCLGVLSILAYAASLAWLQGLEGARYSLVPFVTLVPAGVAAVRGAADRWISRPGLRFWAGSVAGIALLFALNLMPYAKFIRWYGTAYSRALEKYWIARDDMCSWIRAHARPDALVASEFLKDPIYFERPFVSLPSGKALDARTLESFMSVYAPDYVLYANPEISRHLAARGDYRVVRRNELLLLLEKTGADAP